MGSINSNDLKAKELGQKLIKENTALLESKLENGGTGKYKISDPGEKEP